MKELSRRGFIAQASAAALLGAAGAMAGAGFAGAAEMASGSSTSSGAISGSSASGAASGSLASSAAASSTSGSAATGVVDGLYKASAPGCWNDVTVAVSISGGAITGVEVTDNPDTVVISETAAADVPARIVAQQNIEVDATAGATLTSMAIKNAVADCLTQAGANLEDFQKGSDAITQKEEKDAEDWDIVVAGSGFSGFSAAIAAKRAGIDKVLVLEKEAFVGGCSRVIGGAISVMNNSTLNQAAGVDCTEDEWVAPLITDYGDELTEQRLRGIYQIAGDTFSYYYDNGIPLDPNNWYRDYNYAGAVPCFHVDGWSNRSYERPQNGPLDAIAKMADDLGIEVRLNSKAASLVTDGTTVTGVQVEDLTSTYTVNAKKVILATGGFQVNQDMMEQYNPAYVDSIPFSPAGSTGDGITMTRDLDVPITSIGGVGAFAGLNSNVGWYGSMGWLANMPQVILNKEGDNMGSGSGASIDTIMSSTGSCIYGLFDKTSPVYDRCQEASERGIITRFETLEDVAKAWDIDQVAIETACVQNGLSVPPFYGLVQKVCRIITLPGLKVDETYHVVNSSDEVIENLYAVGMLMFGNMFGDLPDEPANGGWSATFSSVTLACCSGAIAGKDAAGAIA